MGTALCFEVYLCPRSMVSKSDKRKPTWQLIVTEVKFSDVGEVVKRLRRHERQPVRRNVEGLEAEDFGM